MFLGSRGFGGWGLWVGIELIVEKRVCRPCRAHRNCQGSHELYWLRFTLTRVYSLR